MIFQSLEMFQAYARAATKLFIYLFINERKETHAFFLDLRWDMEFLFSFFLKKKQSHIFL